MKTSHWIIVLLMPLPAMAQDQPAATLYGTLDAGVVAERGCTTACPATRVSSGVASESHVGIAGREKLNGDVAAVYRLEAGVHADTGAGDPDKLFGRQAFIGLDSRWGVLTLGRQYSLSYEALTGVADPFHGGMAGAASNIAGSAVRRFDNTVKYVTPTVNGWSAGAIYSFGESPFSNKFNRAYGAIIGFEHAPFTLRLAHQRRYNLSDATGVVPLVDYSSRNTLIAANMALKYATIYVGYGVNRGFGSAPYDPVAPYGTMVVPAFTDRSRDLIAGISVPYGNATFMLSAIRKDDRSAANRDATQLAAGVTYALSKRTSVYAAYGKIDNRNGARYTVGNASERGSGNRALTIGLRHSF
ncbi:porin [Pseudoduganella ginsengisoli]|uniref:Porin n=1 Tax=Pseudoduganella ginsengisoli TaxID=1462440 RepID=A0A6L6Q9U4_9BURK|nr:porin [Pseudoduganella ginsengisoli]MTW06012.1 porin [Pseudoduganella ginsengisoli]